MLKGVIESVYLYEIFEEIFRSYVWYSENREMKLYNLKKYNENESLEENIEVWREEMKRRRNRNEIEKIQ